jgi:hypothetical protein
MHQPQISSPLRYAVPVNGNPGGISFTTQPNVQDVTRGRPRHTHEHNPGTDGHREEDSGATV